MPANRESPMTMPQRPQQGVPDRFVSGSQTNSATSATAATPAMLPTPAMHACQQHEGKGENENEGTAFAESRWYHRQPVLVCALEIALLAVAVPGAAFWFGKPLPLQVLAIVLLLLPLMFGLRYGFFAGVAAALGLAGVLLLASIYRPASLPAFPKIFAITLLATGAGAGQFRDRCAAQLRQLHASSRFHAGRFEQFSHGYALLKHSHDQLEQQFEEQLAGGATSLRCLMARLRRDFPLQAGTAALPLAGMAPQMLGLLAEAGSFHAAALYEINEQGEPGSVALASLGRMSPLCSGHPMLREALRCGQVLSLRDEAARSAGAMDRIQPGNPAPAGEPVLALVPLSDASGHVHAVVAVGAMPFMKIHQATFDMLALLARQLGDMLTSHVVVLDEKHGMAGLRTQLAHSLRNARDNGLPVSVAACRLTGVDSAAVQQAIRSCLELGRATDRAWLCRDRLGQPVIVKCLVMVNQPAAEIHLDRLAEQMPAAVQLQRHSWEVAARQGVASVLERLCTEFELPQPARFKRLRPGRLADLACRLRSRPSLTNRARRSAAVSTGSTWIRATSLGQGVGVAGHQEYADASRVAWAAGETTRQAMHIERAS